MAKTAGVTIKYTLTNGGGTYTKNFTGLDVNNVADTTTANQVATKYSAIVDGTVNKKVYTTAEVIEG